VTHVLPPWLEPVLAFVNTVDVEAGTDDLAAGPGALSSWLRARDLLEAPRATRADHRLALDLRSGLRCLALLNNGVGPTDETVLLRLRQALDRFPLVADTGTAVPGLRPYQQPPVRAALGVVVAGYALAVGTGDWSRIRRCPAEDCAWVFWDSSARGTRRWCTMSVCGNRAKVRAFAERSRSRTRPA
jgi:predicted RNA-binding Zn ribbon-like protein